MRSLRHHAIDAQEEADTLSELLMLIRAAVSNRHEHPESVVIKCKAAVASLRTIELKLSVLREHYTTKAADQAQRRTA